jgi:hypothetical protein
VAQVSGLRQARGQDRFVIPLHGSRSAPGIDVDSYAEPSLSSTGCNRRGPVKEDQVSRPRTGAALTALVASLAIATPAVGQPPEAEIGDPSVVACLGEDLTGGVIGRQTAAGIQAGGGPKSVGVAPANCDHYWQAPQDIGGAGAIGNNNWPPPPFG